MITNFFGTPTLKAVIKNIEEAEEGKVIVFDVVNGAEGEAVGEGVNDTPIEGWEFVQTEAMTRAGIAVHKYGAYIIPKSAEETVITATVKYKDVEYVSGTIDNITVGDTIELTTSGGGGYA